jgi:glycosyltransferase involved in cell wall biosynthesis
LRIAIVVTGIPPNEVGGTETQALGLARNLSARHDVTILTRREKGMKESWEEDGYRVRTFRYVNFPVARLLSHVFFCARQMGRMKQETDVFFCMMLSPNGLSGAVARKFSGVRVISSIRGGDWYMAGIAGRMIIPLVIRGSDLITVQKEKIAKEVLEKYPESRVAVIPNGVDPTSVRSHGKSIVLVANLQERKGVDVLLRAMRDVKEELLVYGDGPDRKRLEALSAELGVSGRVKFMGKVGPADVRLCMAKGRVFVLPSVEGEGLPNVILEAMSVGLPVISTRIAGIPDVVKDKKTGLLVEPRDHEGLAGAINRLLRNEKLRREMSRNCIREAKKYSWKSTVKTFESACNEAIGAVGKKAWRS